VEQNFITFSIGQYLLDELALKKQLCKNSRAETDEAGNPASSPGAS
jgi:hypothetical protein